MELEFQYFLKALFGGRKRIPVDWAKLTVLQISTTAFNISVWDTRTLLIDCKKLRILSIPITDRRESTPGRPNKSRAVIGRLPRTITNETLEELRLRQGGGSPGKLSEKMLWRLSTPNLKKVVIEHIVPVNKYQTAFLKNPSTVQGLRYLHLTSRMVDPEDLGSILRASPDLEEFTMAAYPSQWDYSYKLTTGIGIDQAVFGVVARNAPNLTSFKVFGESWLSISSVQDFVNHCEALRLLRIEVWGGLTSSEFHALRDSLSKRHVKLQCAMVGRCAKNPTSLPVMVQPPFWQGPANAGRSDYAAIVHPSSPLAIIKPSEDGVFPRVCQLCLGRHVGEYIDEDGWSSLVAKNPDEYV
ncbi:hypothetical protein NMY22_g13174 [Coprinellus aureogranulatus]|nr:hypothetical protein NMY22_g13174 [Coprinellus aureogranulatus]